MEVIGLTKVCQHSQNARPHTDIQTDEEIETEEEIVIEEIDVMDMEEMKETEERGIIVTEVTEVDMNTGIGRGTIVEEVEDPTITMIEGITRVVVEGKMRVLQSPWDIGIEDHVGRKMLMLLL
jgi:hypothetical protein